VSDAPPGWSSNPSGWRQRVPLVLWSLAGFSIALYLTLFQTGVLRDVWEPFFGEGSRKVLRSQVSYLLPVPDAALGAFGYLFDAATGAVGGTRRWRSMPWMVLLFGLAAGPLGLAGVLLVVLQPTTAGGWCALCILSAVISVGLISPSLDEALASLQYLKRERARGRSAWKAFWGKGGEEVRSPAPVGGPPMRPLLESAALAVGVWLTAAPQVLGYGGAGRLNDWVLGPVAASVALMACWEFMRPLRRFNALLGLWFLAASFLFHLPGPGRVNALLCGLLLLGLSTPRVRHRPELYGGGWSSLRR
jgi:hypothetical protein